MADVGLELRGRWYDLKLAEDQNGRPMFATSIPRTSQASVQVGEATYAARIPEVQGVFVQPDLSGGVGRRNQVPSQQQDAFERYHYADGADASNGIGPGPETVTIEKLTDAGPLSGAFELDGDLYLICGRKIALYDASDGTISEAEDLGAGAVGYGGATFIREGAEASDQSSTGTGATDTITGPQTLLAQKITPTASKDLGRVDLQLVRTDVVAVQTVTITGVPTGGTFTLTYAGATTGDLAYNISAADMQTALRALAGLSAVTVTLGSWAYVITFTGVVGLAVPLVAASSLAGGTLPAISVAQTRIGSAVTGNVELAVQADYNGRPSGADLAVATVDARGLPATAGTVSFRFDDDDRFFQEAGVPYWLVLRAIGATASATVGWTRTTSGAESGATSGDMGNSWMAGYAHHHTTYSKEIPATAFVGRAQGSKLLYTSDGATYAADSVYEAKHLLVMANLLVRDCRSSSAGAISWSYDGLNWSEPLVVGDPTIQITALLRLGGCVVVVKEDSVWAVDVTAESPDPELIYGGGRSTTNGPGSCTWHGAVYIPFDGKLMSITGDLTNGFDVKQSIGPDSADEWDAPFGAGRVVAVAGDRYCLYAAMSTAGSYKLFKSYDPLKAAWHGSIADLGSPSGFTYMKVFDRGGDYSPLLFYSTDSDDVGQIILPRTRVPWADPLYQVSTATGSLYHPRANGNAHIDVKAWLTVSETLAREAAGGYVDEMYDTMDGNGWRALEGARFYQTGDAPMPLGLVSKQLERRTRITAGSATVYPLLAASGLTYAVRRPERLRQVTFTLDAEDELSGRALGDMLGVTGRQVSATAFLAATGLGTQLFTDPDGNEWRLLVINATDTMIERRDGSKRSAVEVSAVTA